MFRLRRSTISIHRLFSSSVGEREILLDHLDSGISILTLNRPSRKNALGRTLLNDLRSTFQQLSAQPTRVLIVRSAVPGVFCAGADLKERMEMNPAQVNAFVSSLRMCFRELENLPQPTIAVIEGSALGGGLELAMACDFRIGSRNAIVGFPETGLAIIPGAGGTQRLARLVGPNMAKRLIFTAEKIEAERAKEINILDILADQDKDSMQVAIEFAQKIIPNGPIAVRAAKMAINKGVEVDINSGFAFEELCYSQVIPTKDRLEGLLAFKEKRKPNYKGE